MRAPVLAVGLLLAGLAVAPGHAAAPASGQVSVGHPSQRWQFASVDSVRNLSDDYRLTVRLPEPDALFYKTHSASLTVRLSWNSPAWTDLDLYVISPHRYVAGFGEPDARVFGAGSKQIVIHNPASGQWVIEAGSYGARTHSSFTFNLPTVSEGSASLALSDRDPDQWLPETPGALTVRMSTVQVPVPGSSVLADLYVPQRRGRYPIVEIVHGSAVCATLRSHLRRWGEVMASRGFLVVVPDRRTDVPARSVGRSCDASSVAQDSEDLLRVLRWVIAEGAAAGSPLAGRVDPARLGLAGHSDGAETTQVAAQLAQTEGPHLDALAVSGEIEPAVDAVRCDAAGRAPVRAFAAPLGVFESSLDVTPWQDTSGPDDCVFDAQTGPRVGILINNASHCAFEDPTPNWSCNNGAHTDLQALPEHQRLMRRYVMAWFEFWLQCDRHALAYLGGSGAQADQRAGQITLFTGQTGLPVRPPDCRQSPR